MTVSMNTIKCDNSLTLLNVLIKAAALDLCLINNNSRRTYIHLNVMK